MEVGLKGWAEGGLWADYKALSRTLDQGLGSLVKDLADKDLLARTLVICATEFGKPPVRVLGGDSHRSRGFSVVLAGGYLTGGIVHGDTGPDASRCTSPVSVQDLQATILCAAGVDWEKRFMVGGRKLKYIRHGQPIEALF